MAEKNIEPIQNNIIAPQFYEMLLRKCEVDPESLERQTQEVDKLINGRDQSRLRKILCDCWKEGLF